MFNNRRSKIALVALMIFSMIAAYGAIPVVKAASFESAKAILSSSDPGTIATTTVIVDMSTSLTAGQFIQVDFNADTVTSYGSVADIVATCPTGFDAASTTNSLAMGVYECYVTGTFSETVYATTTFGQITIPAYSSDGHKITITTFTVAGVEIESSDVIVYPYATVEVSATVDASLSFSVTGVAGATSVNGTTTTAGITPTATTIPFGTLTVGVPTIVGQQLAVTTNAASGYSVTVQQSDELKNGVGATINSFNNSPDNTGSTSPGVWGAPTGELTKDYTWGHIGLISNDSDLDAPWGSDEWAGLNDVDPLEVMSHDSSADGSTQDIGQAEVAYAVQISALQEAGDYTTNLIYVCTPTY